MGNGYPTIPTDELSALRDRLQSLSDRITELERPSGTQTADLLSTYKANQISPAVASGSASAFILSSSYADVVSLSIPVPDGFSRALVTAAGFMNVGNNSATSASQGYSRMTIAGTGGPESIGLLGSGILTVPLAATYARTLSGLSGGSVSIAIQGRISSGTSFTGATGLYVCNATASVLFLT